MSLELFEELDLFEEDECEDFWEDESEFETEITHFKNFLRREVKKEIKEKIASLEKELKELKEFKNEKEKYIREYKNAISEAKKSEEKWKKARLHQLLGEYLTCGWKVETLYKQGEKCDKCDDNRYIHFTSPQGNKYKETCRCSESHREYVTREVKLAKFYVRKKKFYSSDDRIDFKNRYYEVENKEDDDYYRFSNDVYENGDYEFEKVNIYSAVFLNEEDCQKYCDWLNEKELNKGVK